jgi:hypothetical protein
VLLSVNKTGGFLACRGVFRHGAFFAAAVGGSRLAMRRLEPLYRSRAVFAVVAGAPATPCIAIRCLGVVA